MSDEQVFQRIVRIRLNSNRFVQGTVLWISSKFVQNYSGTIIYFLKILLRNFTPFLFLLQDIQTSRCNNLRQQAYKRSTLSCSSTRVIFHPDMFMSPLLVTLALFKAFNKHLEQVNHTISQIVSQSTGSETKKYFQVGVKRLGKSLSIKKPIVN